MIHRQNWTDTRDWLHGLDRSPKTIEKYRIYLRHLIEWADDTPLPKARDIDLSFPAYLITARNDGKARPLSYSTIYKTLTTARMYFNHARRHWPRYSKLSDSWIEGLYPSRLTKPQPQLEEHQYYTLAEVLALATVSVETLHEARAQAGAALLFLSGMRADTLASLPMQCIDLPNLRIYQIPSMGVRTKNNKAAITYLLNVPELLDVVRAWDNRLRQRNFAPNALWYAPLNHDGMDFYETSRAIQARHGIIRDDIEMLCKKLGMSYASPHKFRHGHIVYARSFASNMEEVKAISQNVMHANTIITDQIYSGLSANKVQNVITKLGASAPQNKYLDTAEILLLLEKLKDQLR